MPSDKIVGDQYEVAVQGGDEGRKLRWKIATVSWGSDCVDFDDDVALSHWDVKVGDTSMEEMGRKLCWKIATVSWE